MRGAEAKKPAEFWLTQLRQPDWRAGAGELGWPLLIAAASAWLAGFLLGHVPSARANRVANKSCRANDTKVLMERCHKVCKMRLTSVDIYSIVPAADAPSTCTYSGPLETSIANRERDSLASPPAPKGDQPITGPPWKWSSLSPQCRPIGTSSALR